MTDDLDILLSQPLAPVADDGFSARITARIRLRFIVEQMLVWGAVAAGALVLWLLMPVVPAVGALVAVLSGAAASPAVALAVGSLVLVWAWEPKLFRL